MKQLNVWPMLMMLILVLFLVYWLSEASPVERHHPNPDHHRQGLGVATRKCAGAPDVATMRC